ncbi:MAG TPA: hypothetical protein VHY22_17915 [Chthoniobacteraceae bacterium]|jgi:hydrogenase maturation protease|nr:hypothetical protein [Chthoniobacteraceae bacterium]
MNDTLVDKVAEAVLYEGYILYPYRASSRKNRERFTFGRVYPRAYSLAQNGAEPCVMQTQCLVRRAGSGASFAVSIRFLHPMAREVCAASRTGEPLETVAELRIDGRHYQTWHEAVEREVAMPHIAAGAAGARRRTFSFPECNSLEILKNTEGAIAGVIRRRQRAIEGIVEVAVEATDALVSKVTVRVTNTTPMEEPDIATPEAVLLRTFASTHTILRGRSAEFLSLTDPPPEYALATTLCENNGTWPVLVGEPGQCDTILSSPIILYDYPQIAPESAGPLCDGTEIDEILTLRVMTMTDDEKAEMRGVDDIARRILERTESMGGEELLRMHGVMRDVQMPDDDFFDEHTRLDHVYAGDTMLQAGDRVRIRPRKRADAIDMMLAGKIGLIEAIEQDAEQHIHLALVVEDDPGRDLGMIRQPGHRFFYLLDEVEPLPEEEE